MWILPFIDTGTALRIAQPHSPEKHRKNNNRTLCSSFTPTGIPIPSSNHRKLLDVARIARYQCCASLLPSSAQLLHFRPIRGIYSPDGGNSMHKSNLLIPAMAALFLLSGCPTSTTKVQLDKDSVESTDLASSDGIGGAEDLAVDNTVPPPDTGPLPDGGPLPDVIIGVDTVDDSMVDITDPLEGCCTVDQPCPPEYICINDDHELGGTCKEPAPEGQCWRQEDCLVGTTCYAPLVCPCLADCDQEDALGECVQGTTEDLCCFGDFMCPDGLQCVGGLPGGMPGTCVPPAPEGHCWEDEECEEGEACLEVEVCECTSGCMDPNGPIPGTCAIPACEAISLDGDGLGMPCPTGQECVGFGANLCSVDVFSAPHLPSFCTKHCADDTESCGADAFCLPLGYSSICVPSTCYDAFTTTCTDDSQCKIATNWVGCCVCPEAVTIMELELEKCLFEGIVPPEPFPLYCDHDCDGGELCEECPSPLGVECKEFQCVFTAVQ
jgi:hypothetical protein